MHEGCKPWSLTTTMNWVWLKVLHSNTSSTSLRLERRQIPSRRMIVTRCTIPSETTSCREPLMVEQSFVCALLLLEAVVPLLSSLSLQVDRKEDRLLPILFSLGVISFIGEGRLTYEKVPMKSFILPRNYETLKLYPLVKQEDYFLKMQSDQSFLIGEVWAVDVGSNSSTDVIRMQRMFCCSTHICHKSNE